MPFAYFSPSIAALTFELSLTKSLSFIPNLHSGIPESCVFTTTYPTTSALRTVPRLEINTEIFSMISMKSSLLRYFKPSARQEIAPVA